MHAPADRLLCCRAGRPSSRGARAPGRPMFPAGLSGNITTLVGWLRTRDAIPVAVVSGTLNDIVKRAAHECDRPYLAVATAASVDGYTSFGASITKDGFKQ